MAITKADKKAIMDRLESGLKESPAAVFVGFKGVTVAEETAMRRDMRAENVKYTVARKTLLRRVFDVLGLAHKDLPLEGEVAIAYGGADGSVSPRMVHEFGKKMNGKLSILGGIFEGTIRTAEEMREIATIPGMDTLRAMFAQVINSPRTRFAVVLSKVAEKKN